MAKAGAFTLEGLELWFNSSDHEPPHIHVTRRGKWDIRVFFLMCTDAKLDFNRKWDPPAKTQAAIRKAVVEHQADLLRVWEQKVCRST